ncbi:NACHT domain-containing protein [Nostoc sp. FACHB-280]|uniref:NACHT domain-containing protein n=1 Tax=Nostoc sp. FACHB-280 TaxID=2692839 RepID=UPI00168B432D|nr:ATP-binding protein [Nostoc sp. FACHB-280]MBD2498199.1 NACHT domain-containing protein [Nostoc sp. FACHB-280]
MPTFDEALAVVDDLVGHTRGKSLSEPEILIMRGSWNNREFVEIAEDSPYSINYLQRGVATRLWEILTKTIGYGQRVNKKNVRNFLEQAVQRHHGQSAKYTAIEGLKPSTENLIKLLGGQPPDISNFYGRTEELSTLKKLIAKHRCVSLIGAAGIGKTALAAKLIQEINAEHRHSFDYIIWKSVAHTPSFQDFVNELLTLIYSSESEPALAQFTKATVSMLISYMQAHRCLLILDESDSLFNINNLEQKLEYKLFFRRVIEEVNHSCLLLTHRVFPDDLEDLVVAGRPVSYLKIKGLDANSALQFLYSQGLENEEKCSELVQIYYGNPLELKTVANRINHFFGGSTEKFLENKTTLFSSQLQAMLDQSFGYLLNELQRQIMIYLAEEIAVGSQWTNFNNLLNELKRKLQTYISTSELILALETLEKLSLIETFNDPNSKIINFTLQPAVKKYILKDPQGLVHSSQQMAIAS